MKKRKVIFLIFIFVFMISFIIPIRKEEVWVNDEPVYEVGHYEFHYKNIYGLTLKKGEK